jgi:hypothetical protein
MNKSCRFHVGQDRIIRTLEDALDRGDFFDAEKQCTRGTALGRWSEDFCYIFVSHRWDRVHQCRSARTIEAARAIDASLRLSPLPEDALLKKLWKRWCESSLLASLKQKLRWTLGTIKIKQGSTPFDLDVPLIRTSAKPPNNMASFRAIAWLERYFMGFMTGADSSSPLHTAVFSAWQHALFAHYKVDDSASDYWVRLLAWHEACLSGARSPDLVRDCIHLTPSQP